MLTQSARLGERGSIPEGSQRPSMYSQTIFFLFFLNQRYLPKSLSTCVSKSAFTLVEKLTLASASWSRMPGHLGTQMGQHLIRLSVAASKAVIPSFRRAWACLHTTGYFRGDSLQKSHLKTERTEFWNKVHCKGMNRSPKNVRLNSPALRSPAGLQYEGDDPDWAQSEAAVGAGPERKPLLYYLSSSSLLILWMGWERAIWSYFSVCFAWLWSWFQVTGTCHEARHVPPN